MVSENAEVRTGDSEATLVLAPETVSDSVGGEDVDVFVVDAAVDGSEVDVSNGVAVVEEFVVSVVVSASAAVVAAAEVDRFDIDAGPVVDSCSVTEGVVDVEIDGGVITVVDEEFEDEIEGLVL